MTESQSRYSIVERLTRTKLDLISAKAELDDRVTMKEYSVDESKNDYAEWKKNIVRETDRVETEKKIKITQAEDDLEHEKSRLQAKRETYDNKLEVVEKALLAIQDISKNSTVQANE